MNTALLTPEAPMLVIGCGNMGRALVEGWRASGIDAEALLVVDRNNDKLHDLQSRLGVPGFLSLSELPTTFTPAVILLATKPAGLADAMTQLTGRNMSPPPLVLSVAAGKNLAFYESHLWPATPVVRIMPNTPVTVMEGVSACIGNARVTDKQKHLVHTLMEAVGMVAWIADESRMHQATALSGSGPAYIFYIIECLIEGAIAEGMDEDQARALAIQTVRGAAGMAAVTHNPISQLRKEVTSPGGTTQAALNVLMEAEDSAIKRLIRAALKAAAARSEELSKK